MNKRCDVAPENYATIIRELIRHENDVTNHRIMWLLVAQGFLANAYVIVRGNSDAANAIASTGIIIDLSALVMLYRSYQARSYLHFLGDQAKQGKLPEEYLPLDGWPAKRIKGWEGDRWFCSWLERPSHLLEPYLLLPVFSISIWGCAVLNRWSPLSGAADFGISLLLTTTAISLLLTLLVKYQKRHEHAP